MSWSPTTYRTLFTRAGLAGAVLLGVCALLLGAAHLPFVRSSVLTFALGQLEAAAGVRASVEQLDYNLLTLRAGLRQVVLAAPGQDSPFFRADRIEVDLPWSIVLGTLHVQSTEVDRPRVVVVRGEDGASNLPETTSAPPSDERAEPLGPIIIDRLAVRDLGLVYRDEAQMLSVDGSGVTLDLARDGVGLLSGRVSMSDGVTIRLADRETGVEELEGRLTFDGTAVGFENLTLRAREADLSLDGRVDLLSAEPRLEVSYRGNLDLEPLARWVEIEPSPRGQMAFAGRLDGPLDRIEGTLEVNGEGLEWSTLRGMSLAVRARLTPEAAILESLQASLSGGEIAGEARLSLEPDQPSQARVTWRDLDLGTLAAVAAADLPVRLAAVSGGVARLDWPGLDVLAGRGAVETTLRAPPGAGDGIGIEGDAVLSLDAGAWRLSLDQRIAATIGVTAEANGRLAADDLGASTLNGGATLVIDRLEDALGALGAAGIQLGQEAVKGLRAGVAVEAELGGTVGDPRATGRLDARDVQYEGLGPGLAFMRFDATARRVTVEQLHVELGSNRVEARAAIGLDDDSVTAEMSADLQDVAQLAGMVPADWRPSGTVQLQAKASGTLDAPSVDATLSSPSLAVAGQTFTGLRSSIGVKDGVATLNAFEVAQGEGRLVATGRYELAGGRYRFEARGKGLTVSPIPRAPATPPAVDAEPAGADAIPVSARFDLELQGEGTLEAPSARGSITADHLAWDRYTVGAARLDARVDEGRARVTVDLPRLPAHVEATVGLEAPYAFTADLSLQDARLTPLVAPEGPAGAAAPDVEPFLDPAALSGAVTARITASGALDDPAAATADVELRLVDVEIGGAPLRLPRPARLRYADRALAAEDVELQIGGSSLSITGRLGDPAAPDDGLRATLMGTVDDFMPLVRLAPGLDPLQASGRIAAEISASGPLEALDLVAGLSLDGGSFAWADIPPVADATLRASYTRGLLDVQDVRAGWQGATLTAKGAAPVTLLGDDLPDSYRQSLPELPDRATAEIRLEAVTQHALAPFLDSESLEEIAGRFDVSAKVEARSLDLAGVTADVTIERADLELARVPFNQVQPSRVRLADGRLELPEWQWAGAGNRITAAGSVVLTGDTPELDLGVTGTLDLRMLGAFARDVATAGLATLDVRVTGSAEKPAIEGRIAIENGDFIVRDPRVAITDLQGVVALTGGRIELRDVTGSANGGTLRMNGEVQVPGFELAGGTLSITGRGLGFAIPEGLRTEIDADLQLALSETAPSVRGRVTVLRGSYREPISLTGQLLTRVQTLSEGGVAEAPEPGIASQIGLAIDVVSAENIAIDNNYGRLEIGSALKIVGTAAAPSLAGRLTIEEGGQVFLGGRNYRVRRGTVDFTSATRIEPNVDLVLETRVQRYDITLQVSGTPETLEATLTSPGVSQADVVSLLLTGQTAKIGSAAQTELARGQLLMLLSGELLGFAGRAVGLDTVQVSRGLGGAASDFDLLATDTDPTARLTIGKRLSRDVQVIFSQSLRESGDITWLAIYQPLRNVEIRGTTRDDAGRSYEFRHDLDFGGVRVQPVAPSDRDRREDARVTAVRVTGTPGFPVPEVERVLKLEAGDRFDFLRWQDDRERLERYYHERDYLEARIIARRQEGQDRGQAAGVALEYRIERGRQSRLTIDGFSPPGPLVEQMKEVWARSVFDGFLLEDLSLMARRHLAGQGHLRAEVAAGVTASDPSVKQITLRATPGTRFERRRIQYAGLERLSAAELAAVVRARGLEVTAWLEPRELEAAIERQYQSIGSLGATVTVDPPEFDGGEATLPVRVAEGRAFRIAGVAVQGVAPDAEAGVRETFGIETGGAYRPPELEPARRAVEVDYLRQGYNDVRVTVTTLVDREQGTVDLGLRVDAGRQQVVSNVEVTGAEVTARSVINRALDLAPGRPANLSDAFQAQKRLYDTGAFRLADVEFVPLEDAEPDGVQPVSARVTLQELPRYRFRYGFRLNDELSPLAEGRAVRPALVVDLLRRNLFGRAASTGMAGQLESSRRLARGVVTMPRLFGLPVTTNLFLTGSRERFTPLAANPFLEDVTALSAEQRFRPALNVAVSYAYSLSRSHVFDPEPNPFVPVLDLNTRIGRFTSTYAWDTRDDPTNATRGWFQSSGLELGTAALGSDLRFVRYLGQQYYFKSVGPGLVLASAFRIGAARDLDFDDLLQPAARFLAGGSTTVRGFAEDGLGDPSTFGGGNSLVLFNQELRFPIFSWARGIGFIDAGNVFPRARNLSFTSLEAGAGFGLRIHSPFVLLRIDYGMPLTRRSQEPFGRWYFGIGQTF